MSANASIADRFETVSEAQPEWPAVHAGGQQATYEELATHAARIAHHLLQAGLQPGDRVALCFERGVSAFAAWLGVLRAGAIVVPLVPAHPVERLRLQVGDASPRYVLSDSRSWQQACLVADGHASVLDVDGLEVISVRTWPRVRDTDPATILYTSGSSGKPKGVIQTHRNILHHIDVGAVAFGTTRDDRISLLTWYAMAQGMIVTASALLCGATLCVFDVRRDGLTALAEWLDDERISMYVSVSSLFRSFARTLDPSRRFPDVRLVRIGGERVTPDDVSACRRHFGSTARVLVSYAATEAGPIALHQVHSAERFPEGIVPVGRALDGVTVVVRDEHGRQLPDEETGELIVRSAYLSDGYWGQPTQTAQAFSTPNDAASTGEREYHTGDLGRIRNGCIEHLGRIRNSVQIGGLRIELEEVEAALLACPDVLRGAVLAKPRPDNEAQIVAYVQPIEGRSPTVDTLRSAMEQHLPEQMIPSRFLILETLALTDSGKIDRQRLPEPPAERPTLSSEWAEPITPVERVVAATVGEILGVARVGRDDAILSMGADSLMAGQVASRLSKHFGKRISLGDLLRASTVARIAALVEL